MALLPSIGVVSYNSITFDASYKSRISAKMVRDAANRTITYIQYDFHFVGIVYADPNDIKDVDDHGRLSTQSKMTDIQQSLSHPGKDFVYKSNGFGDLEINTAEVRDVAWGPLPEVLELYPLGAQAAWHLEFKLSVCIPQCPDAVYEFSLLEFVYEAKYSLNERGYLTHVYSGHITIPMTRINGGMALPDTVDRYRELIVPAILPFFIRTQEFTESLDKRTMTFTITDKQFEGELPYECLDADGSHEVSSVGNWVQIQYQSVFSARYVLAPTADRKLGLEHFMAIMRDRLTKMDANNSARLISIRSRESLYKNPFVISFSATIWFRSTFKEFINDGGQFRLVPDIDPDKWKQSVAMTTAMGPRGQARMASQLADDVIVDLCNPLGTDGFKIDRQTDQPETLEDSPSTVDTQKVTVDPAMSWVDWENEWTIEENPGTVRMKTLPIDDQGATIPDIRKDAAIGVDEIDPASSEYSKTPGEYEEDDSADTLPTGWADNTDAPNVTLAAPDDTENVSDANGSLIVGDTVQKRGKTSYRVTMSGFGIRAGWGVPIPRIQSLGATQVVEEGPGFYQLNKKVAQWSGVPIFMSRWRVTYIMDRKPPSQIPILYNPLLQV